MPGQRGLQGRFIGWGAVAVLAAYALFVGGSWAPTYSVFFRVLTLILAAVGLAAWVIVAIRDPFWRPGTALAPAFVAALGAFLISTLTSNYPRFGFEYLAWSILLASLYLFLQRLMASPFFRSRLIGFATISSLVIGVWYLMAVVLSWVNWWGIVGRVVTPPLRPGFEGLVYGNPSAALTASVLLTAPAFVANWGVSRARSALAVLLVLLSVFVIVASGSRAGWLALGLTLGIVGGLWIVAPSRRRIVRSMLQRTRAKATLVAAGISVLVVGLLIGPGLMIRAAAGGETLRGTFYLASLRMFESSPFVGTGPGTWAPLRMSNTLAGETDYYIPHAHSIYFQTVAEFGLLGVGAGLVVAVYLGRLIANAIRDPDQARRNLGWVTLFTTVYFAAHQLLDFYPNAAAILFTFAIPIALLDATSPDTESTWRVDRTLARVAHRLRPYLAVGGAMALIAAIGFLGWSERAASQMSDGTVLLNDGNVEAALGPLSEAVALDPAMPPYHLAFGLALADTGESRLAETEFEAAATDDLPEAWLDLAAVRADLGDQGGAREALKRALRIGEQQPEIALSAGTISLQLNDRDDAVARFAHALALLPSLAGDPWWTADPVRADLWDQTYATAFQQASALGRFELAIETGRFEEAQQSLESVGDAEIRQTFSLIAAAWAGDAAAFTELEAQAQARPLDTTIVNWCARLLRRNGQDLAAERYRAWAETDAALSSVAGVEARVVDPDAGFQVLGVNSLFYGHFTYRRPTPTIKVVHDLPMIGSD